MPRLPAPSLGYSLLEFTDISRVVGYNLLEPFKFEYARNPLANRVCGLDRASRLSCLKRRNYKVPTDVRHGGATQSRKKIPLHTTDQISSMNCGSSLFLQRMPFARYTLECVLMTLCIGHFR